MTVEITKGEARILRVICELILALESVGNVDQGTWDKIRHTAFQQQDEEFQ